MWQEARAALVPVVEPLFREAFIVGAEMGAMQNPAPEREGQRAIIQSAIDEFATGLRAIDPGQQTVLPYDFEAINSAADEVIGSYTDAWWQQFSVSTQNQIRRVLARAERNGWTTADVARELAPLFGPERAQTIAISELTDLLGMGAQETYNRAGYTYWEWRTVRDSRVDPICKGRDRQRYPMSSKFRKAHVRCRCWPVPSGKPSIQTRLFAA